MKLLKISIIVFLFCLLIALFYSNRAFLKGVTHQEDLRVHEIPSASFFINTIKEGSFPLWNPYKACGIPFFELSFMGPYYPAVVLYFLLPMERAINYGFLIHIFMSAIFLLNKQFLKSNTYCQFFREYTIYCIFDLTINIVLL